MTTGGASRIDLAFDLANQLPEFNRELYLDEIIATWRNLGPIGLFESIGQWPSNY